MKYKSLPLALFFLAAIALTARAQTAENLQSPPVALTEDRGRYPLGLHLDILEDAEGELTIEDVAAEPFAGLFASSQVDVPNFGFTESVYWVRFRLDNQSRQVDEWLLEQGFANTHYIDFYTPLPDGTGFAVAPSGVLRPPENRSIRHQHIIFNLHLPPQSQETFYLRFQSGASMTMDLKLWEKDTFLAASQVNQVWNGIFYGLLIGLFAYNLFLLVSFREATYLYFEILLGASILFFLSYDGFAEIYLFPDHYFLVRYSMPLFMTTMFSSMVLFADAFLELKQYYQKIHRVNLGILAVWLALLLITPLSSYYFQAMFMAPWGMVSAAAILIAAIVSLRRDSRPTRFFVVAWSGLLITYILALMVREGLVPSTPITENTLRVGLAWMAVSSSIALADRINLLKAETDSARHRLAQILDGLPLGVIVFKKDLKPSFSNRRVGEIVATPWQDLRDDPAGAPSLAQSLQDYSARMAGSSEEYPLDNLPILSALRGEMAYIDDIEISRGDERIVLEIQASPVRDDAGNIETAVVAIQDITYRKGIEAELEEHRLHLERLVEERTRDLNAANNELHAEATERTKLEKSLSQRVEWLSLINNILPTINGAADLYQAYERITADIYEILRARMVFLFRWNEEAGQAAIFHDPGQEAASPDLADLQSAFQISSPLRNWLEKGKPVLLNADPAGSFPRPFEVFSREDASGPLALARLVARGDSIGVLGVLLPASSETSRQQEVALINKMASDLARLSLDASLIDQAFALAQIEERNRLARELHDSVTQTLFTASVLAEATPRIWEKDQSIARTNMEKLSVLIRGALAEMRSLLIELRSSDFQNQDLEQLLNTLVEAARARSHAEFSLSFQGEHELPKKVTEAFYRVARESLNNVIVHAQATRVDISLSEQENQVTLRIKDNGRGFDPQAVHAGHLGIGIMDERARGIGGHLAVRSHPGQGAEISLSWTRTGEPVVSV